MTDIESMDGRIIGKVYNAQGDLVLETNSPAWVWKFNRQEPLDFMSKHVPGGKNEVSRVYIAQGMEIVWA